MKLTKTKINEINKIISYCDNHNIKYTFDIDCASIKSTKNETINMSVIKLHSLHGFAIYQKNLHFRLIIDDKKYMFVVPLNLLKSIIVLQ